jgi:hypothetical protein
MHAEGERYVKLQAERTYAGDNLLRHVEVIQHLVARYGAKTLLDYGSGKGRQYTTVAVKAPDGTKFPTVPEFWGVEVTCYDPGYPPFARLPAEPCDGVICTDVLEHCPEEDAAWIVDELFAHARKFVYANVACYEAQKRLPNGENAHCTIKPHEWWAQMFARAAQAHAGVRYCLSSERMKPLPDGTRKRVVTLTEG